MTDLEKWWAATTKAILENNPLAYGDIDLDNALEQLRAMFDCTQIRPGGVNELDKPDITIERW